MKSILLSLLFIISSTPEPNYKKQTEDMIKKFIELSEGKVVETDFDNVVVIFEEIKDEEHGRAVGLCYPYPWQPKIVIDTEWWNKWYRADSEREQLMFHELGHCILNREHTEKKEVENFSDWIENMLFEMGFFEKKGYLKDGCPSSYMHPYVIGSRCIEKHYDHYIEELFNN